MTTPTVTFCAVCGGIVPPSVDSCSCVAVLDRFRDAMLDEIESNRDKGGQSSWRLDHPSQLLDEVHDHVAKLHVAMREWMRRWVGMEPRALPWDKDLDALIVEFGADVANTVLVLLDRIGLLTPKPCGYCNDTGWVEDKNAILTQEELAVGPRPGRGLIRCCFGCPSVRDDA